MKLGKAKYSGEKKEVFKIKDGDNVYRILPPMGNLADAGVWSKYYRVVWGYKDTAGNNRPFLSPRVQNFNTKMIEVECAAQVRVDRLKKELTEKVAMAKEFAKNKQPLPEELKTQLEELKELVGGKGRFNIDSKHHMNAMTQDGKIGLLKLAGRGYQALKAKFKQIEAAGSDPTGVENASFMNIHREGSGLDTVYSAEELMTEVQVEGHGLLKKPMKHTLDQSIIGRLEGEAFELDSIYPAPSAEEVAEIVAAQERSEEEGREVLTRILGARDGGSNESSSSSSNAQAETKVEQRAEAVAETPQTSVSEQVAAETTTVETQAGATEVNTQTGEIVSETPAAETTVETAAEVKTETTASAPQNDAAQSDADFLAGLGVNLG